MLVFENVFAGYGKQTVLRDVSQDIQLGGISAIVGPNGHGKSTLMGTISGMIAVQAGRITFQGNDITSLSPQARLAQGIVHVPQGDRLFPVMTVEENLLIGGTILNDHRKRNEQFDWVMQLMPAVAERKNRLCSGLSGGERRLVGIARGLMTGCKFMMLDEPSLGLSPIAVEGVYKIISKLAAQDYSFLIIEENLDRVYDVARHLMFLENGQIEWSGAAADLKTGGRNLKKFLGGDDVSVR
ncbi:ABC transporter ATP-binding protein [Brucella grignonensis]|uniref:ABC transporter ATP-binding protein n=1 Tax=Brucella grignonensis TaxID=94627 RepID=UPI0035BC9021